MAVRAVPGGVGAGVSGIVGKRADGDDVLVVEPIVCDDSGEKEGGEVRLCRCEADGRDVGDVEGTDGGLDDEGVNGGVGVLEFWEDGKAVGIDDGEEDDENVDANTGDSVVGVGVKLDTAMGIDGVVDGLVTAEPLSDEV